MRYSPLLQALIDSLRCLPGVGPKTAQRMAFQLMERDRQAALGLSTALAAAAEGIRHCSRCRMFTDNDLCEFCVDPGRDAAQLCVVEGPADAMAVEQSTSYKGRYFVLMGHLSPIDGIGPEELGLDLFEQRLADDEVREVILATGSTVEGEATAHFLAEMTRARQVRVSRIAYGVPVGGELEYVDGGTLAHAFSGRQEI